jgi:hypothetical protein
MHWHWYIRLMAVLGAAATMYALTAFIAQATTESSRQGCERGNVLREEAYRHNLSSLRMDRAVSQAVVWGSNAAGVRKAMAQDAHRAKEALERLTVSPGTSTPWAVNCTEEISNPLPWIEQ